jgi:hypothetical protein
MRSSSLHETGRRSKPLCAHEKRSRAEKAIESFEDAAKIALTQGQVNLRSGTVYLNAERNDEAYKPLLIVRRLYSKEWEATVALAVLDVRSEDLDTGHFFMAEALQVGGETARSFGASFLVLDPLLKP